MKLGVSLSSLDLPVRRGLAEAAKMGVAGVQLDAAGDLHPDRLSQTGRRELRNTLRSYGLELTALNCPLRRGLDAAEDQWPRIEHVRKILSLSFDLGPRLVVVQAGGVPEKPDDPRAGRLGESLLALGQHGDRVGARLALETGLESGPALADYLRGFDTGGLAVNYDPANLLLNGFDPLDSLPPLATFVAHVHAHDARKSRANRTAGEVPLGAGDIDWMTLLASLSATEYRGWVCVEREQGEQKLADLAAGVTFLKRLMP